MSAESKRARLSPEEYYQLKWLCGAVLTLLSVWTLGFIDTSYIPLSLVVMAVVGAVLMRPDWPSFIPDTAWKLATPLLIVYVILDFLLSRPEVIAPLIRMVTAIAVYRTLQYRKRREDLQLVMLCLFIIVISGVLSLSLAFGIQVLLFTPVAMTLLFLVTVTSCSDRPEIVLVKEWRHFLWRRFLVRMAQTFDARFVGFITLLFLLLLVFSSVIFAIMPRFRFDQAIPFLKLRHRSTLSGFSDTIQFGDVADILQDNSVAFRVDLTSSQRTPPVPYWRMVILDEYTGEGFRTSFSAKSYHRILTDNHFGQSSLQYAGDETADRWTFYYEGGISKFLPLIGRFQGLRFSTRQSIEYNEALGTIALVELSGAITFYQLEKIAFTDAIAGHEEDRQLSEATPQEFIPRSSTAPTRLKYPFTTVGIPPGETNRAMFARILEEVTEGQTGLPTREFAERLQNWLHRRHAYSLQSRIPSGDGDRLLRWALSNEPGHCELFAGAFVLLSRAAGYPARVATGFVGGAWNGYENYYMIRNSDAHAWVEIYLPVDNLWLRIDPTPGARGNESGPAEQSSGNLFIDRTFAAYFDSLRVLWYRRVVNFDEESQQEIVSSLGSWYQQWRKSWINRWLKFRQMVKDYLHSPWDRHRWWELAMLVAILTALMLLARWAILFWRWWHWRKEGTRSGRVWNAHRRKAGELALKLRDRRLTSSEETYALYQDLLRVRFGPESDWPPLRPLFRRASRTLRSGRRPLPQAPDFREFNAS